MTVETPESNPVPDSQELLPTNPTTENTEMPTLPTNKFNVKKALALGLVFIVVITLLAIVVVMGMGKPDSDDDMKNKLTILPSETPVQITVVVPTLDREYLSTQVIDRNFNTSTNLGPVSEDSELETNEIYLVKYQGKDALYVNMQNSNGSFPELRYYEDEVLTSNSEVDIETLTERVLIFRGRQPYDDLYLTGFTWDQKQEYFYFSMVSHSADNTDSYPDTSNVFRYNSEENKTDIILQKKIFEENFLDYEGAFNFEKVLSEEHLILSVGECYACDGLELKTFVLNLENLTYKQLADDRITDLKYNASDNTVHFRLMSLNGYGEGEALPIPTFVTSTEVFTKTLP